MKLNRFISRTLFSLSISIPMSVYADGSRGEASRSSDKGPVLRVEKILGCGSDFQFTQFVRHSSGWNVADGRPAWLFFPTRVEFISIEGKRVSENLVLNERSPVGVEKEAPGYYGFPFVGLTCQGVQAVRLSHLKARSMVVAVYVPEDTLDQTNSVIRDIKILELARAKGGGETIQFVQKSGAQILSRKPAGAAHAVRIEESGVDWSYNESFGINQ